MFKISVVIPCKNEGDSIKATLSDIANQRWVHISDIIVADSSDDDTRKKIDIFFQNPIFSGINCKTVDGGLPAKARNSGFMWSSDQEYTLFIDADIRMKNDFLLHDMLTEMEKKKLDLASCRIRSYDGKYNWVYKLKDISHFLTGWKSPFAIGGFMLFRSNKFSEVGMFEEDIVYAEDYWISKKIDPRKFSIPRWAKVYTSSRRFEKKKPIWMIKMAILSFLNRENRSFFQNSWNYWD